MTSYTLLQFPDRLVLVRSKPAATLFDGLKAGDYFISRDKDIIDRVDKIDFSIIDSEDCGQKTIHYKGGVYLHSCASWVIAGHGFLPSVDVRLIAETIGWVDVQKLALDLFPAQMEPIGRSTGGGKYDVDIHYSEREGFYQGFHKAQELNKNKFTEEDMKACWEAAEKAILDSAFVNHEGLILYSGAEVDRDKHTFFHGRQQPKQWRVEVEMEEYLTEGWVPNYNNPDNNNLEESAEIDLRPKVTNNTIKILKVIQ